MNRNVVAIVALLGCSSPLDVDVIPVDITGDPIVSPLERSAFSVTAENSGSERIVWGMGSSSCQLGLAVIVADERYEIATRTCTGDFVELGLDPGGTRTEVFLWGGEIIVDDEVVVLGPGRYQVFGYAGERAESKRIWVTVVET